VSAPQKPMFANRVMATTKTCPSRAIESVKEGLFRGTSRTGFCRNDDNWRKKQGQCSGDNKKMVNRVHE
jgi:hypothetical protein